MSRIAVIGAGFAGLTAATSLNDAGHTVTVFEARDRVGGRVWSEEIQTFDGPRVIERGAEFVLDAYTEMQRLAEENGLSLVETGMSYYVREPGDVPFTAADIVETGKAAGAVVAKVGPSATAEDVLQQLDADPQLVDTLRARIEISTAVGADEVTAGALTQVASFEPKKSWRVGGGNQSLPKALAAQLDGAIRMNTPVTRVESRDGGGATVTTADGREDFDAVVVAVPFSVLRDRSVIEMPTTAERERALDGVIQGHAVKLHAPLERAPETSAVMSVAGRYWTWTAVDASGDVAPVLNSFMGSHKAIDAAGVAHDPSSWLSAVRELRPDLAIGDPAIATVWSRDPYAQGAYTAHASSLTDADTAALEAPIGDVHFAGEYADPNYTGLMEGAIRSGQRAAQRVLESIELTSEVAK
ncbi:FAD-dependent oxidoreductase [Arthrobacter sp. JZ12]|uniref:flavin monoamine oxidase family protein n=1 Tax=Arthrobacter sp. JZ12 TaxID=2654190 RepID=UPI002B49FE72|nr:NAD(P)/FAD-dependent oxidoreductase [Arthrobacter sp. JZ12]WRH24219.1 FAD-dependent oxidoreductase [Arthrobacter sp. JZ12]